MLALAVADPAEELDNATREILDAALAEFEEFGIRRTSVGEIAKRAGIHRATIYRRFPSKDDLVAAAAVLWTRRFFGHISEAVAHLPGDADRLVEGFVVAHRTMRDDPFVNRMLTTERDTALPFLTVDGGPVLAALRDLLVAQTRATGKRRDELVGTAEIAVRIGLSLLLTPDSHFQLNTDDERRAFALRWLITTAV